MGLVSMSQKKTFVSPCKLFWSGSRKDLRGVVAWWFNTYKSHSVGLNLNVKSWYKTNMHITYMYKCVSIWNVNTDRPSIVVFNDPLYVRLGNEMFRIFGWYSIKNAGLVDYLILIGTFRFPAKFGKNNVPKIFSSK